MSATFQSLPREILRLIFIHFCEHFDLNDGARHQGFPSVSDPLSQHTLFSLCLVSRSFHDVAQVLLYRRFLARDGKSQPGDSPDVILERWNVQLRSFLRTITERRDLAALVRSVTCNTYYTNLSPFHSLTHSWKTIAFIANKLRNIKQYYIDFRGALSYDSAHIDSLKGRLCKDVSEYFFNLLDCTDNEETDQKACVPLLDMKMSDHIYGAAQDRCLALEPPMSPKLRIETLCIVDSWVHRMTLHAILSRCIDLKTFIYEVHDPGPTYFSRQCPQNDPQFDHFEASQSLAICKDSLETLHLDLRQKMFFASQLRSGSSLESLTALQSLLVDSFFICSKRGDPSASPQRLVEMLPPNLVSLEMVGCPGKALPVFAKIFIVLTDAIREGRFQALRRIQYGASSVSLPSADTCFSDLAVAERFAEFGVAFTYNHPPFDDSELAKAADRVWENGVISYDPLLDMSDHEILPENMDMRLPDSDIDSDLG